MQVDKKDITTININDPCCQFTESSAMTVYCAKNCALHGGITWLEPTLLAKTTILRSPYNLHVYSSAQVNGEGRLRVAC